MENKKNLIKYLLETENPYKLRVDDMTVEMEYSKNDKFFNECILNILKLKIK